MKIKMTLLSDTIFGNGISIPGGEDISVLTDEDGFPYYKATSLKGIFREELENLLSWQEKSEEESKSMIIRMLGESGDHNLTDEGKIRFGSFTLSDTVKKLVKQEIGADKEAILRTFSYLRTFTAIEKNGMVKEGSLRSCRCLKKGLIFYGTIDCREEDKELVKQVLSSIKWLGTMRNRGFGQVKLEQVQEGKR